MSIIIRFDEPIVTESHLKKAIGYVMQEYKTQGRTFSNSGTTVEQIMDTFFLTKEMNPVRGKRQGYHLKFSFSADEKITHDNALEFIKDWAEEYLGDSYDYVVAEHSDRELTHMHLVFNSVKRTGGKYHYDNREWKQKITPLTNRICEKYATGKLKEKDRKLDYSPAHNWKETVENDIDQCIEHSQSYKDFKIRLQQEFGYNLREGISEKHGVYLALTPPGKGKAIRSYHLKSGYIPEAIEKKIGERMEKELYKVSRKHRDEIEMYRVVFRRSSDWFINRYRKFSYHSMSPYQQYFVRQVLAARRLYSRTNTTLKYHEQSVRAINRMMKDISLLYQHNIRSERDLSETISCLEKEEAFKRNRILKKPDFGKEERLDEQHEEIKELKRFRRNQGKEVTEYDRRTKQQNKTITKEI